MEQKINKIINAMKIVLKSNSFKEDEDGNMVCEHNESRRTTIQYRFNFMHSEVRLEQRENRFHWTKMGSESYKKIKILKDGFIFNGNKIAIR